MLDDKSIDEIFDKLGSMMGAPPEVVDHLVVGTGQDVAAGPVHEILCGGKWYHVQASLFESWTGRRMKNGEEYHGSVRYADAPKEKNMTYTGSRVCACSVCQASVEPKFKKN